MFDIKKMPPFLRNLCCFDETFNFYRVVDPETHTVFDYDEKTEELKKTDQECYGIWKRRHPCRNCISKYTCFKNKQFIKIEYLDEKALLILSTPIEIKNKIYSLELVKDVTNSIIVANQYQGDSNVIRNVIEQFNEIAVLDSQTGLYNKMYIRNEIGNNLQIFNSTGQKFYCVALKIKDFDTLKKQYSVENINTIILCFSEILKKTSRLYSGNGGRISENEFVILFKDENEKKLIFICEKIAKIFNEHDFNFNFKITNFEVSFNYLKSEEIETTNKFIRKLEKLFLQI